MGKKKLIEISAAPKQVLGMEITDDHMKLVLLRADGDVYVLEKAVRGAVPEGAIEGIKINDVETLSELLKKLIILHKIKTKKVAVAVLPSNVMTKVIPLDDNLDEDSVEQQLSIDADKHIPYSMDEVRMDFQILGPTKDKKNKQDVLLVATHREPVDNYMDIISGAGLTPEIVDVYQFALLRACELLPLHPEFEYSNQMCVAFIEISLSVTRVVILNKGEISYTEEQTFPEKISETCDIEDSMSWYKRNFQIFSANNDGQEIETVLVYGDRAGMDDLNEELALYLNKTVMTVDPFNGMKVKKGEQVDEPFRYLIAAGLALREELR